MNAKWCISNRAALALLCLLLSLFLSAQENGTAGIRYDTAWIAHSKDSVQTSKMKYNRYDQHIHRLRRCWVTLIPTHTKIQFAGNMGLMSFGFGWDYGKRNQWETDVLFGVLPKYQSARTKLTFTLKQNYIPWKRKVGKCFSVEPLSCGMYLNTIFGDEFWVNEPDRYPKGYYGFSSKIRIHAFLGQRVTYDINLEKRFIASSVTFFYELSTSDLYIVSAFTNKYLRPKDYLSLSFGIKLQLL